MNTVNLVGRLVSDIKVEHCCRFTLAITRTYKNCEGIYDTDFIDIECNGDLFVNTLEYLVKGDLVGVSGMIQSNMIDVDKGDYTISYKKIYVLANRISFLGSRKIENTQEA